MLIRAWNDAGWMDLPARLGDRVGRLIGAPAGTVVMGDTLSIKVYQAVAAALEMRPERRVILSDHGNFPSDLYMVDGLLRSLDRGHELRLVAPEEIAGALDEHVAVLMLTEVDYRTGRKHDMAYLTDRPRGRRAVGRIAHSGGAVPIDGSPCARATSGGSAPPTSFSTPAPEARLQSTSRPKQSTTSPGALRLWLGHASPFAFDLELRCAPASTHGGWATPPSCVAALRLRRRLGRKLSRRRCVLARDHAGGVHSPR